MQGNGLLWLHQKVLQGKNAAQRLGRTLINKKALKIWAAVSGAGTAAALIVAIIVPIVSSGGPAKPPSTPISLEPSTTTFSKGLKVVALAVGAPKELDAEIGDEDDMQPWKIRSTSIDVTVKNVTSIPIVIRSLQLRMIFAEELENCVPVGGPAKVTGHYHVKVPSQPPETPFWLTRDVRFEVKPASTDRFVLSVGPQTVNGSTWGDGWLYAFEVFIEHDEAPDTLLKAGTASIIEPSGKAVESLEHASIVDGCFQRNGDVVAKLAAIPAARSAEVSVAREGFGKVLRPDRERAKESCTHHATPQTKGDQLCTTYSRHKLALRLNLQDAVPVDTLVVFRIKPTGTVKEFVASAIVRPDGECLSGEDISIQQEPVDPTYASPSCMELHSAKPAMLTEAEIPIEFTYQQLAIHVEMYGSKARTARMFKRVPTQGALAAARGNP